MRSLLEGAGIGCVIQGEQHASMIPGLSAVVMPRVLVAREDLARAQALIAASPVLDHTEPEAGASLEGAVCPVHEQPAVATCGRCGTFLCAACPSLGNPPMCEDCLGREAQGEPRRPPARMLVRGLVLAGCAILVAAWLLGAL